MRYLNEVGHNDQEVSNLFAKYFASVYCVENDMTELENILMNLDNDTHIELTEEEVVRAMRRFQLTRVSALTICHQLL